VGASIVAFFSVGFVLMRIAFVQALPQYIETVDPDGSTTTTVTEPDGSMCINTYHPDGSLTVEDLNPDGTPMDMTVPPTPPQPGSTAPAPRPRRRNFNLLKPRHYRGLATHSIPVHRPCHALSKCYPSLNHFEKLYKFIFFALLTLVSLWMEFGCSSSSPSEHEIVIGPAVTGLAVAAAVPLL